MLSKVQKFVYSNPRRATAIIGVVMLLCALLAIGGVYAKYIKSVEENKSVIMKDFYFTSDLLDGNKHTLSAGSTEVTFTLGNHADELRFSDVDIDYKVTINKSDAVISNGEGTLSKGSTNDKTITISNLTPGTYTITATGKGGYHQELSATIVIPNTKSNLYYYLDTSNSEFVVLTVWAQGFSGDVTIKTPENIIPDNTDMAMREVKVGDTFTDEVSFKDNKYSSHAYRFFGSGVSVENFTVSGSSNDESVQAEIKKPSEA